MGWWKSNEHLIGDGPLDHVEELMARLVAEYLEDHGRKPRIGELLECIGAVLRGRADEFTSDTDTLEVLAIVAKTRRRSSSRRLRPGDIFRVPLSDGTQVFGRLTPQAGFAEFFRYRRGETPPLGKLLGLERVRFPCLIDAEPIQRRRWKVIGHVPWREGEFRPQPFLVGDKVTCAEGPLEVFTDASSRLRPAAPDEWKSLPKLAIWNEAGAVEALERGIHVV